jgi:hypothetical protein
VEKEMNQIKNDRGQYVTAVGAPGSKARAAVQYPALIEKYESRYNQTCHFPHPYCLSEALDDLQQQDGIDSYLERKAILSNTSIS